MIAAASAVASLVAIALVLMDGFEAMLLPRRVTKAFRFSQIHYRTTWTLWSGAARRLRPGKRRNTFLSLYGPLSIVVLFGLWALGLIVGFAVLNLSIETPISTPKDARTPSDYLYMSGVTFFTLGYGDVTPTARLGRLIAIVEAGIGFGFLAAVIGYLPVLYSAFSRREVAISLLDARAGSPPTAGQILLRIAPMRHFDALERFLEEWEHWAAEVLESHLSFPVLTYYRSQHDNQSWLAALTAVLDACALIIARVRGIDEHQARLTFAMARHAVVDLAQIYRTKPLDVSVDRLPYERDAMLRASLRDAGLEIRVDATADAKFEELRAMYEPFVNALAYHFLLDLPPIAAGGGVVDNWQTSAWMRRTAPIATLSPEPVPDDHDD